MKAFTAGVVAALALGVCTGIASPQHAAIAWAETTVPPAGAVDWKPCTESRLSAAGAVCGSLEVPLDHAKPGGAKISIALSMVRHTVAKPAYLGIMLVNPGGPGGSGRSRSTLGAAVPNGAGSAYDWIGFDPRGVGASEPSLSCDRTYFDGPRPDYTGTSVEVEKTWLARSMKYAAACKEHGGALLDHVRTTDTVADMESIRIALGQEKINFYGYSYGTYLGQTYATLHPDRVARMVLDSIVDPRKVWYEAQLSQDVAFEGAINEFFGWIATWNQVYHLGATAAEVRSKYFAELDVLRHQAIGGLGPDEFDDAFLQAGYREFLWPAVADAFVALVNRNDAAPAEKFYRAHSDFGNDNSFAMYSATQCTDAAWPADFSTWRVDAVRTAAQAPFNTWGNLWYGTPCLYWAAKPAKPVVIDGAHAPAILMTGGTLDGATPFSGAIEVRHRFPAARLVSIPGQVTHANSLGGNSCVDEVIAAYLSSGALPPRAPGDRADLECKAEPKPVPKEYDPLGLMDISAADLAAAVLPHR